MITGIPFAFEGNKSEPMLFQLKFRNTFEKAKKTQIKHTERLETLPMLTTSEYQECRKMNIKILQKLEIQTTAFIIAYKIIK